MALRCPPPQKHRHSQCLRHPNPTPPTGLCPPCLRERLAGVESSPVHRSIPSQQLAPDILHRSKSSSAATVSLSSSNQPRRKSCDAHARSTLLDLFSSADERKCLEMELGLEADEIRVCGSGDENAISFNANFEEESEFRTVREFMDLELQNNARKDFKGFWNLSAKLRKWRRNEKTKKQGKGGIEEGDHGLRRRSCEIEPRVPIGCVRNSLEEPRASLDGYLLGRTYLLTPMVSVLEDAEIIHSHGGLETKKKTLELQSAIDRSSSQRRQETPSIANGNVPLNARELFYGAKLVITEKELMAWNSEAIEEEGEKGMESATKKVTIDCSITVPIAVEHKQPEKAQRWWSRPNLTRR